MQESFHDTNILDKEKFRQLIKKSNHPGFIRFVIMYILFLGAGTGIVLSWGKEWWLQGLAYLGFSILVCSIFAALHETAHGTAFKTKSGNGIAAFLAGLVHVYPSSLFRELHFTHHRHTHKPGIDPEISMGGKPVPSVISSLPMYMGWITGLPMLMFKINMLIVSALGALEPLRKGLFPFIRPNQRHKVVPESLLVLSFNAGIVLLALYYHQGFWGIFIGQATGHALLCQYLIMEHNGLPHEGTIFEKTRSMKVNGLVKLVMWNMPYHAEHHAYPAIPFYKLPELHKEINSEIRHKSEGHFGFHMKVLKKVIGGK